MSKTAKAAVGLMAVTMFSKVLGFAREMALGAAYGTGGVADAYVTSMNIPTVIFALIGSALATSYIPLYSEIRQNKGEKAALEFSNNITSVVLLISLILTSVGIVFTEPIVKLFAIGYTGEKLILTVKFTRILFLSVGFIGITYIIKSYLESNGNFIIPGLAGVPYNIIIITSILISAKSNVYILVWGALAGIASQFLIQVPFAIKKKYKFKLKVNLKDEYLKKMLILITPILIGASVNQFNALVDRTLASTLIEGSVAALNYANRLNQFVMGLFIVSITAVIYPLLSNLSSQNDNKKFADAIVTSINSVALLVVPVSAGAMILAQPIVKVLFERGAFTPEATKMTSIALVCYSIGLLAFGVRDILTKSFYALKDTKTPMKNGIIAVAVNVLVNITLIGKFKIAGLALATSISAMVGVTLLYLGLRKKIPNLNEKKIFSTLLKTIISSIVMCIVTKIVYINLITILNNTSTISEIIALAGAVLSGAVTYSIAVVMLKVETANYVIKSIKQKFKRH